MEKFRTSGGRDQYYRGSIEVQQKLLGVAEAVRLAISRLTECINVTESDSDVENRCQEALEELESALYHVEWEPTRDKETH